MFAMPHKRTFLTVTVLFLLLFSFFLTPLTTANATHVNGAVHTTTNTTQQEDPGFAARAAEWLVKQVIIVVVMLSMLFLLFGGILMDTSINFTIYGFGNFARLESIVTIWETFRDAANIALIFVFLFIAIMTILGSQNYGARRLLAKAIIVALILNFSLFFARLVPDLANQLAVQFHKSMVTFEAKAAVQQTATAATQNQAFLGGTKVEVNGLSGAFMQVLGITSVLNWDAINNAMTDSGPIGTGRQATFGIGMAILFFTLAGVFFSAALLLISRLIILIILMVLSAPAFVAYALPKTSNLGSTWM